MNYRYAPAFPPRRARDGRPGSPVPASSREEKRRRAALAAGMLLVPLLSFGGVLGLYLVLNAG
jgi:hypothetical protein